MRVVKNRPPQLVEAREFVGGRGKGVGYGCPGYGAEDAIDKRVRSAETMDGLSPPPSTKDF